MHCAGWRSSEAVRNVGYILLATGHGLFLMTVCSMCVCVCMCVCMKRRLGNVRGFAMAVSV